MRPRGFFLVLLLFGLTIQTSFAQLPVDLMAGQEATEFSFFWFRNLDEKKKIELFNFTFFAVNYTDQSLNEYEIYQSVTYRFSENWGVAAIGRFAENRLNPQAALAYQYRKADLFLATFPYVQFSSREERLSYGTFGFIQWTPVMKGNWRWFGMMVIEVNLDKYGHNYSFQQLRLGVQSPKKTQFGLGATLGQSGSFFEYAGNYGAFIRKEF